MKIDASAWPQEKIATLDLEALKALSANAKWYDAASLVELCEAELASRNPKKPRQARKAAARRSPTEVVVGYHFVCGGDRGVTLLEDGRFKSGSWVVSEDEVLRSLRHGAYLALHESKADVSYRQGHIVGYEMTERNMLDQENASPQTKFGVEFLVEATNEPSGWVGEASGEKGYNWKDTAAGATEPDTEGE